MTSLRMMNPVIYPINVLQEFASRSNDLVWYCWSNTVWWCIGCQQLHEPLLQPSDQCFLLKIPLYMCCYNWYIIWFQLSQYLVAVYQSSHDDTIQLDYSITFSTYFNGPFSYLVTKKRYSRPWQQQKWHHCEKKQMLTAKALRAERTLDTSIPGSETSLQYKTMAIQVNGLFFHCYRFWQ